MFRRKSHFDKFVDELTEFVIWAFIVVLVVGFVQDMIGCSSAPSTGSMAPAPKYQLTLSGTIDGVPFHGIGIGSAASSHNMVITSQVSVNYFTMQSCHRSVQFVDVIDPGWFNEDTSFSFTYTEAPTIEDTGDCLLRLCAFSKVAGSPPVACGVVDFMSSKYTFPGKNICNGVSGGTSGTAFCTSQVGLIERFQFAEPVVIAPQIPTVNPPGGTYWISGQCQGQFLDSEQTLFQYTIPDSECTIVFMQKAKPHARAKLTVIPWNQAQYPGAGQ